MQKLKAAVMLETAFGTYSLDTVLGEGGAGRVYGGMNIDGITPVAIKVLSSERTSKDKRSRFKKEIAFLSRNVHPNIVAVTDHGVAAAGKIAGPFFVMKRYDTNLRALMEAGVQESKVLPLFARILDGVEAAHLLGVTHRDLKPENILSDAVGKNPVVADFGIASFTEDLLVTMVETAPTQRLANFQYAAPEQRIAGQAVSVTADIYALGLMLNELFTGTVPHGTEFKSIAKVVESFGYLDKIVAQMIRQSPADRPQSIAVVKTLLQQYETEEISHQRLSELKREVVKIGEIDEPLALEPPRAVGVNWTDGRLKIKLDRPVTSAWVQALHTMGNYTCVMNRDPRTFHFNADEAFVSCREHEAQQVIDYFKQWLPQATNWFRYNLEQNAEREAQQRSEALARERAAEELNLRINSSLRI